MPRVDAGCIFGKIRVKQSERRKGSRAGFASAFLAGEAARQNIKSLILLCIATAAAAALRRRQRWAPRAAR
jgi:hypothetical protein